MIKCFGYLRYTCPNTEFFLVRIFLYSVRIQEITDQKKFRIWTFHAVFIYFIVINDQPLIKYQLIYSVPSGHLRVQSRKSKQQRTIPDFLP